MEKTDMKKRLLPIISVILIISACLFFFIALSLHNNKGYVSSANMKASTHYKHFSNGQIDLSEFITLNSQGDYYIYGECHDFSSYTAYSGDVFNKNTLIYGSEEIPNSYWAIKIHNRKISAAWSSNYPLKESQLIPYSIEEQEKQAKLFQKSDETKIIGYYDNEAVNK